jgi:transcription elongation factor Elf1
MSNRFKNAEHLIRVALVFVAGLVVFVLVRGMIVPKSFGQYGHYRADALKEIADRAPKFAGRDTCEACHQDVADLKKTGKHVIVGCEACHGPLGKHAEDPAAVVPAKLDTAILCVKCHEANSAKPKAFPQVISKEHAGEVACGTCHQPHKPKIGDDAPAGKTANGPTSGAKK